MREQLPIIVKDEDGDVLEGCFYINKYGGTDEQDAAYHWIPDGDDWKMENGERVVGVKEGRFAAWDLDGAEIVGY